MNQTIGSLWTFTVKFTYISIGPLIIYNSIVCISNYVDTIIQKLNCETPNNKIFILEFQYYLFWENINQCKLFVVAWILDNPQGPPCIWVCHTLSLQNWTQSQLYCACPFCYPDLQLEFNVLQSFQFESQPLSLHETCTLKTCSSR